MKKKIMAWSVSIIMILGSMLSCFVYAETKDNIEILEIYTEDDLRAFADSVNIDGITYEGETVSLLRDITLEKEWTPIGTYPYMGNAHLFRGTFEGNGHVIRNLQINEKYIGTKDQISIKEKDGKLLGFFGSARDAVIKNLTLYGSVTLDDPERDYQENDINDFASHVGSVVAMAIGESRIIGCTSYVSITVHSGYAGGIAGTISADSFIRDSVNQGDIVITKQNWCAGGIVGQGDHISRCRNEGNVEVQGLLYHHDGGRPGQYYEFEAARGSSGGITGKMGASLSCSLNECVNHGDITGRAQYTGGLIGRLIESSTSNDYSIEIVNSYNTGVVEIEKNDPYPIRIREAYAGGLIGVIEKNGSVEKQINLKNNYSLLPVGDTSQEHIKTDHLYNNPDGADIVVDNCLISDEISLEKLGSSFKKSEYREYPILQWEEDTPLDETAGKTVSFTFSPGQADPVITVYSDEACSNLVAVQADGTYCLPAGKYFYKVDAEGYFPVTGMVTVSRRDVRKNISLIKQLPTEFSVIPEDAVFTLLSDGLQLEPESQKKGHYIFTLKSETTYSYIAQAPGYITITNNYRAMETGKTTEVILVKSKYDENAPSEAYIYGTGNTGKTHTISKGGTYYIGDGATGVMTIDTTEAVTLVGKGISDTQLYRNLCLDCEQSGTKLTLQDVGIQENSDLPALANVINFTGGQNVLTIEGICLLDYDYGYTEKKDALIHVPHDGSLTVNGAGTLYQYNCTQGAGIGGDTGEMNGEITFALTGSAFIKGTRQGAVIGAGANASGSGTPGNITFLSGTYNLETNSRGAAIGGSAGSGGASEGTNVYIKGGSININCDYTGSAVGGGGYVSGNDASGGTVCITGGSLRTYIDKNAASNENGGFNDAAFTEGVNDAVITAQRVNASGEKVYKCVFDTTELGDGSYAVQIDGEEFYTGGRHAYAYVNEALSKDEGAQVNVSRTQDNWIPNDEPNLYFYLTGKDHTITVGGRTYQAVWNPDVLDKDGNVKDNSVYTTGAFTVEAAEASVPKLTVTNYTDGSGATSPAKVSFAASGTDFTVQSKNACVVMLVKADGTIQPLTGKAEGDTRAFSVKDATEEDRIVVALKGDMNLDGKVNAADVTYVKAVSLHKTEPDALRAELVDLNGDGKVTVADVTALKAVTLHKSAFKW